MGKHKQFIQSGEFFKIALKMSKDDVALSMPPPYPGYQQDPVPDSKTPSNSTSAHIGIECSNTIPTVYGTVSVKTFCKNCQNQISTKVDESVSGSGWTWAILCCLCGSWIASCFVFGFPGFRRFTHTCPKCNVVLGQIKPDHSTGQKCLLIMVGILIGVLMPIAIIVYVYVIVYQMSIKS